MGQRRTVGSLAATIPFGINSQMTRRDSTTPLSCEGEEMVSGYRRESRVCPLDSLNSSKQELRRGGYAVSLDRLGQPNDPPQLEAKSTHTHFIQLDSYLYTAVLTRWLVHIMVDSFLIFVVNPNEEKASIEESSIIILYASYRTTMLRIAWPSTHAMRTTMMPPIAL